MKFASEMMVTAMLFSSIAAAENYDGYSGDQL